MTDSAKYDPKSPSETTAEEFEVVALASAAAATETQVMDRDGDGTEPQQQRQEAVMAGACVVGGCVGCLLCGPWWACALGGVSGYLTTRQSAAGDAARSMGQLALTCRSKAAELDEKHHVVDRSKAAAVNCWEAAKDANQRHKFVERTQSCCVASWQGMKEANEKHKIADRTAAGIGSVCSYLNAKLVGTPAAATAASSDAPTASSEEPQEEGEARVPQWNEPRRGGYAAVGTESDGK